MVRGDESGQLWNISNIGDKYLTIVSENMQQTGPNDNETIKVVDRNEIYPATNIPQNLYNYGGMKQDMFDQKLLLRENDASLLGGQPGIHFNPIIVVGNDNTTGADNAGISLPVSSGSIKGKEKEKETDADDGKNIKLKKTGGSDSNIDGSAKSESSSILDFAKGFFVKKQGQ